MNKGPGQCWGRGRKSRISPSFEVEQVKQEKKDDGKEYWDWKYECLVKFKLKCLRIQVRRGWSLRIITHHSFLINGIWEFCQGPVMFIYIRFQIMMGFLNYLLMRKIMGWCYMWKGHWWIRCRRLQKGFTKSGLNNHTDYYSLFFSMMGGTSS